PGLTVPAGLSSDGLPVGVQFLGPMDSEPALLRAARALEANGERAAIVRGPEREVTWPGKS
ncbi:MAG: hypothetical protein K8R56_06410, partial [Candidatus Eisenbacteria bacterium]|nr:hypothetical protein [Candidatus Eisenbacteria bacterium]